MKSASLAAAAAVLLLACPLSAQIQAIEPVQQNDVFEAQLPEVMTLPALEAEYLPTWEVALAQAPLPTPTPGQAQMQVRRTQRIAGQPGDVVAFSAAPMIGPWWKNSEIANDLHLTDQQKKEIDQSFYQYRMQLIDATASTQKLDTRLDALMNAEYLEEGEINQVLDQLVVARGQLSKIYAGMLISIRKVLLPEQWKKLQTLQAEKGVMPMMFPPPMGMTMGMPAGGNVIFNRRIGPPGAPPPPPAPPNQP
ncbi:MAG: Spy/CpxP family protein refolding chaperone [Candidatus Korobacteraceae bacterium]